MKVGVYSSILLPLPGKSVAKLGEFKAILKEGTDPLKTGHYLSKKDTNFFKLGVLKIIIPDFKFKKPTTGSLTVVHIPPNSAIGLRSAFIKSKRDFIPTEVLH